MRVTLTSGATTYELRIGLPSKPTDALRRFHSVEELADFLTRLLLRPENRESLASLKRALLSDGSDTRVRRIGQDGESVRRLAQSFSRSGGVIVAFPPKPSGGGGGSAPVPVPASPKVAASKSSAPLSPTENEKPLTEFEILEVTFLSDHDKLQNYGKDWKNDGKRFPKPEWRAASKSNHPVSHTHDTKVSVKVKFRAGPPDGRRQVGELRGKGSIGTTFESGRRDIGPGVHTMSLECFKPLPVGVTRRSDSISWSLKLETDGLLDGGSTGPHTMYCTYGTPMDDHAADRPEDGVTLKRMDESIGIAADVDTEIPHKLVRELMHLFQSYSLNSSEQVPEQYCHPHYRNTEGGSWAMLQYRIAGECQAIVRFVLGVIRQLGVPGTPHGIVVFAHPDEPQKARFELLDNGFGLLRVKKIVGKDVWKAALTDAVTVVGKPYQTDHKVVDGVKSPGFNSYEACLRFTEGGKTAYYGGGIGEVQSIQSTLNCFKQLVWMERVEDPDGDVFNVVREIVATYSQDT